MLNGYSTGTREVLKGYSRVTRRAPEGRHLAPAVKVEPQQVCPPQLEVLAEHELPRPIASHRIAPHRSQPHEARRHVPHKARTPGRGGHARIGPRRAPFGQARAPQACRRVRGAVRASETVRWRTGIQARQPSRACVWVVRACVQRTATAARAWMDCRMRSRASTYCTQQVNTIRRTIFSCCFACDAAAQPFAPSRLAAPFIRSCAQTR